MTSAQIRLKHLLRLIEHFGTIEQLAVETGSAARHLSQIKNGTRKMGDRVARRFEEKLQMPPGAMDREMPSASQLGNDKNLLQLVEFYLAVSEERQAAILSRAQVLFNEQYPGKSPGNPYHGVPIPTMHDVAAPTHIGGKPTTQKGS